jgi:hypothetical protein
MRKSARDNGGAGGILDYTGFYPDKAQQRQRSLNIAGI